MNNVSDQEKSIRYEDQANEERREISRDLVSIASRLADRFIDVSNDFKTETTGPLLTGGYILVGIAIILRVAPLDRISSALEPWEFITLVGLAIALMSIGVGLRVYLSIVDQQNKKEATIRSLQAAQLARQRADEAEHRVIKLDDKDDGKGTLR